MQETSSRQSAHFSSYLREPPPKGLVHSLCLAQAAEIGTGCRCRMLTICRLSREEHAAKWGRGWASGGSS
eukprot:scaffold285162_cov31-Tisochrysis_lutea.AAC.4